jgi:hypothetical protein
MLIEIAETHPAAPGKKMANIVAAGGQRFEVYPEKLAGFTIGKRYDVDIKEREFNGTTFRTIVRFAPVTNGTAGNGRAGVRAPELGPPANGSAAHGDPQAEAEFVGRALAALINVGAVTRDNRDLYDAVMTLRGVYGATLGSSK